MYIQKGKSEERAALSVVLALVVAGACSADGTPPAAIEILLFDHVPGLERVTVEWLFPDSTGSRRPLWAARRCAVSARGAALAHAVDLQLSVAYLETDLARLTRHALDIALPGVEFLDRRTFLTDEKLWCIVGVTAGEVGACGVAVARAQFVYDAGLGEQVEHAVYRHDRHADSVVLAHGLD